MARFKNTVWALIVVVAIAGCQTTYTTPLTFDGGRVRIPQTLADDYRLDYPAAYARLGERPAGAKRPLYAKARLEELTAKAPPGKRHPVILYLHGCGGIWVSSTEHLDQLASLQNFIVVAPDSFARQRPQFCFSNYTVDPSVYHEVVALRQAEIRYTLARIAALPWVDKDNIFLIGHSQGGGLVAGYGGPVKLRGRVLINGACNAGLGGDGMRDDEALLTFDSGRDPWFVQYSTDCRRYVLSHPNGQSIYEPESRSHNLAATRWPELKAFLLKNLR